MSSTDPTLTAPSTSGWSSNDEPTHTLDPPTLPFVVPTTSNVTDARPSSARTSFTRVDHGDDEQPIPSSSQDLGPLLPLVPTTQDIAISSNAAHQSPELTSTLSQDKQQSVHQPPTPSTQPQVVLETVPQMPQTYLTFLLISGRRRTMSFEPESAIGRVKELVWNSWPTDWQDDRPPAPSYLRVLYLGKMLQDDEILIGLKLPTHTPQPLSSPGSSSPSPISTIMHLSIRPYAPPSEGDGPKKKKRRGTNGDSGTDGDGEPDSGSNCCNCVIC